MRIIRLVTALLVAFASPVAVAANFEWASPTRDATINVAPANNSSVELRGNVTGSVEANESTVVQPSAVIITPRGGELRVETPGGVISHDFGNVLVKTESARFSATLSNVGDKDIAIAFNGYSGDSGVFGFSEDCAATLPPAATCRMEMWFAPEAAVASNASLSLTLDSALTPSYTFTVTGTGVVEGYAWKADSWSVCSNLCGTGTQTRGTWCERSDGLQVDASSCTATTTPDSSQSCTAYTGCTYSWVSTSWGACSVSCGGGTQERTNSCQRSDGAIVADSFCAGAAPATTQVCNTQSCSGPVTYSWKAGAWGACSGTCGSEQQTRSVWCESSIGQIVADSNCTAAKLTAVQSCATSCAAVTYSWNTGAWSACSASPCGAGSQTRSVQCRGSDGLSYPDSACSGTKPVGSQACTVPCSVSYGWNTGSWGLCSNSCGTGTQTRPVWCESSSGAVVNNSNCSGTPPAGSTSCTSSTSCVTYNWNIGSWGPCTGGSCGTGSQSRSVACYSSSGLSVAFSNCPGSPPVASQSCSLGACAAYTYRWVAGAYSACPAPSTPCPVSNSVQSQTCMRSDNVAVVDSYCIGAGLAKPVVTAACTCVASIGCAGMTYVSGGIPPHAYACEPADSPNGGVHYAIVSLPSAPNGTRLRNANYTGSVRFPITQVLTHTPFTQSRTIMYDFSPQHVMLDATCTNGFWRINYINAQTPLSIDGECPILDIPPYGTSPPRNPVPSPPWRQVDLDSRSPL